MHSVVGKPKEGCWCYCPRQIVSSKGLGPARLACGCLARLANWCFRDLVKCGDDLRQQCPTAAGVYGMLNEQGHLIYVGKAKSLRRRLLSYFHAQADDAKAGEIAAAAERIVWQRTPHELVALCASWN